MNQELDFLWLIVAVAATFAIRGISRRIRYRSILRRRNPHQYELPRYYPEGRRVEV